MFIIQRYTGSDEECDGVDDSLKDISADNDSPKKTFLDNFCSNDSESKKKQKKRKLNKDIEQQDSNEKLLDTKKQEKYNQNNNGILDDSVGSLSNNSEPKIEQKGKKRKLNKNIEQQNLNEKLLDKKQKKSSQNINDSTELVPDTNTINSKENFCILGKLGDRNTQKIKTALPKWLSNPTVVEINLKDKEIPISELKYLDDCSKKNLQEYKINFLFPIQSAVIPWLMQANRNCLFVRPSDLCVSAPTGSGKTLAFVLPIIQSLKNRVVCAVRALIVLPVIELAIQVYKVFETFIRGTDLKVALLTGQKSFTAEQNVLIKHGNNNTLSLADIVVTTPGRILDHIHRTKGFSLLFLRYLVIDEADRMMEDIQKGWLKQIEDAVYKTVHVSDCKCFSVSNERKPSAQSTACSFSSVNEPLQKLLYSATLSHDPEKLHTLSLYRPKLFISGKEPQIDKWIGKCPIPENLVQQYIICETETKPMVLCHYVLENQFKKVLCFTESVERAQRLNLILGGMGFVTSKEISSNYSRVQRKIIFDKFNSGKVNVLVCSDLVARGIDLENVDCVISYDLPQQLKTYIHRIGRTARAGKKGTAVALITQGEFPQLNKMLKTSEVKMPDQLMVEKEHLTKYVESFQNALSSINKNSKKNNTSKRKPVKLNMK